MPFENDTIVAVSTPPGRGGIGIVRLSGPRAIAIATTLLRLRTPLIPGRVRFAELLDEQGRLLDQVLVTFFAGPRSYTGEDVLEISGHGSPVLLDYLLRACLAQGARLAEPGEFTQRAFLHGRMDLTQAEAVGDLIHAQTLHQARIAAAQLGGALAHTVAPIKQQLLHLIAELEAGVDFAEDDLDLLADADLLARLAGLHHTLTELNATYTYGRIVHEGFTVALVGQPNAGKSSLFNRLLGQDRAIVTAQPGTTRDPIAESLSCNGIPVRLIDTAGLRELASTDSADAEREGIRRSRTTMAEADLVLHVLDATCLGHTAATAGGLSAEDAITHASLEGRPHLLVINKSDLLQHQPSDANLFREAVVVSARTGAGIEELKQATLATLIGDAPSRDTALLTTLRQHESASEALAGIVRASDAAASKTPHEFLLLDLYASLSALDLLTGATAPDAILSRIFATFCIGK